MTGDFPFYFNEIRKCSLRTPSLFLHSLCNSSPSGGRMETDFLIRFPFIPSVCECFVVAFNPVKCHLQNTNIRLSNSCPEAAVAYYHATVFRTAQVVCACDVIISNICCDFCSSRPLFFFFCTSFLFSFLICFRILPSIFSSFCFSSVLLFSFCHYFSLPPPVLRPEYLYILGLKGLYKNCSV